jgi:membrane protein
MKKLRDTITYWLKIARMSSEELAALTLPPWVLTGINFRNSVKQDYLGLIAAGVAFYFLLAAFPMLAAIVSVYGLFLDPHDITAQLNAFARFLPRDALSLLIDQASALMESTNKTLSLSLIISVLFTLYSATRGVSALIKGFNIAYDATERRGMFHLSLLGYALTFLLMLYFMISLVLVAGLPAAVQYLRIPDGYADWVIRVRWPLLFVCALAGLEFLYTVGPCRKRKKLGVSAGSVAATVLWIGGSSVFSLFVSNFGAYNQAYGSLGAVVVLMLWFWVSAMTILIGAEINGALEKHRTPTKH